jgi:lysylphosphatidylglycerol synthetase-like protein (DUF2156 family)
LGVKNLLLIFALALLWALSGFLMGAAINALFSTSWLVPCTALNVITGLILLLLMTRNDYARHIFYEGAQGEEPGLMPLALLWVFPFILILVGIVWWLLAQLFK